MWLEKSLNARAGDAAWFNLTLQLNLSRFKVFKVREFTLNPNGTTRVIKKNKNKPQKVRVTGAWRPGTHRVLQRGAQLSRREGGGGRLETGAGDPSQLSSETAPQWKFPFAM